MEGNDLEAIRTATQNLVKASQKIGEEMYKRTAAGGGAGTPGPDGGGSEGQAGNAGGDEKVVDAEYTEVNKDKK